MKTLVRACDDEAKWFYFSESRVYLFLRVFWCDQVIFHPCESCVPFPPGKNCQSLFSPKTLHFMAEPALLPVHPCLISIFCLSVIDFENPGRLSLFAKIVSDFDLNCPRFRYLSEQGWVRRSENEQGGFGGWRGPRPTWREPWRGPKPPVPDVSGDLKQLFAYISWISQKNVLFWQY